MEGGRTLKIAVLAPGVLLKALFCSRTCISVVLPLEQNHQGTLWDQGSVQRHQSEQGLVFLPHRRDASMYATSALLGVTFALPMPRLLNLSSLGGVVLRLLPLHHV